MAENKGGGEAESGGGGSSSAPVTAEPPGSCWRRRRAPLAAVLVEEEEGGRAGAESGTDGRARRQGGGRGLLGLGPGCLSPCSLNGPWSSRGGGIDASPNRPRLLLGSLGGAASRTASLAPGHLRRVSSRACRGGVRRSPSCCPVFTPSACDACLSPSANSTCPSRGAATATSSKSGRPGPRSGPKGVCCAEEDLGSSESTRVRELLGPA